MNIAFRKPRVEDHKHLDFIRGLPCLCCGDNVHTEAAHIRMASMRAAKRPTGMGEKPDDCWTVPLCGNHHREQHGINERVFWLNHDIDPIFVALALKRVTGNHEEAEMIIREARHRLAGT